MPAVGRLWPSGDYDADDDDGDDGDDDDDDRHWIPLKGRLGAKRHKSDQETAL